MQPVKAFETGNLVNVPFMSGSNAQDGMLFSYALVDRRFMPSIEYVAIVGGIFNTNLSAVKTILEHYPADLFGDNKPVLTSLLTDYVFFCSGRYGMEQASSHGLDTYLYQFARVPPHCFWPKRQVKKCFSVFCNGIKLCPCDARSIVVILLVTEMRFCMCSTTAGRPFLLTCLQRI
jgi:carboxylesterase type B